MAVSRQIVLKVNDKAVGLYTCIRRVATAWTRAALSQCMVSMKANHLIDDE